MPRRKTIDLNQLRRNDAQADGLGGDMFAEEPRSSGRARRIELLPLSAILPDRFQPRPLLPNWLRGPFFAGEITCYEAAAQWLDAANDDPGIRDRVETLLRMGHTFESHGQIKPITGAWTEVNGDRIFLIETGERRYWAACLDAVVRKLPHETTLQVLSVDAPARERQVIENQHAEAPTAVGRAREIAALLLEAAEVYPDARIEDDYDYFRQALALRQKMETWARLEEIIGITRPHMTRLLKLLNLTTPLLELADRYQVPERVLREILDLPKDQRERALITMIEQGGTHVDAENWGTSVQRGDPNPTPVQAEPAQKAARKLRSVFRSLKRDILDSDPVGALASWLVAEMHDQKQLEEAADMLEDLAQQVRARLWRNED